MKEMADTKVTLKVASALWVTDSDRRNKVVEGGGREED